MKSDPEFNLKFVNVVKKYEAVYNPCLNAYSNKLTLKRAWQDIANELNTSPKECKERWRCLRVSLLRELRANKMQDSEHFKKVKKPYYLAEAMQFLIPFTRSRFYQFNSNESQNNDLQDSRDSSELYNNDSNENENPSTSTQRTKQLENLIFENYESHSVKLEDDLDVEYDNVLEDKRCKCGKTDEFESETFETYKRQLLKTEEDSDLHFFKSLLPDMKKLTDKQKRLYKQRAILLFDEILNQNGD